MRKLSRKFGLTLWLSIICTTLFSQIKVSGVVVSKYGDPIANAQLETIPGRQHFFTSEDGTFSILLDNKESHLKISASKFIPKTIKLSATTNFRIELEPFNVKSFLANRKSPELSRQSVVTRTNTFRIYSIDNDLSKGSGYSNFSEMLQSRLPGISQKYSSNGIDATRIPVLRDNVSFSGNNFPLIVLDGIPLRFRNNVFSINGGIDWGNILNDLTLGQIDRVEIVKGPQATFRYGMFATNGVIVIHSISDVSKDGISVQYTPSIETQSIKSNLTPSLQNSFGQGSQGLFSYSDGSGGGINDETWTSWGPSFSQKQSINQWKNPGDWQAHNSKDLFKSATRIVNSLQVNALKGGHLKLRFSWEDEELFEVLENMRLERRRFYAKANYNLPSLKIQVLTALTSTTVNNRGIEGFGNFESPINSIANFYIAGPRSLSYNHLQNQRDGFDPLSPSWIHHTTNLAKSLQDDLNQQKREFLNGHAHLTYSLSKGIDLKAVIGGNLVLKEQNEKLNRIYTNEKIDFNSNVNQKQYDINTSFTANILRPLSSNVIYQGVFGYDLLLFGYQNIKDINVRKFDAQSLSPKSNVFLRSDINQQINAITSFFQYSNLSFNRTLSFSYSLRADFIPQTATTFFSLTSSNIGLSVILSEFFGYSNVLPYTHLHFNYSTNQFFPHLQEAFNLASLLTDLDKFNMEQRTQKEIGLGIRFLKNRLRFNGTYYVGNHLHKRHKKTNEFLDKSKFTGWELELSANFSSFINGKKFELSSTFGISHLDKKATTILSDSILLSSSSLLPGLHLVAKPGQELGEIYGTRYSGDLKQPALNPDGSYVNGGYGKIGSISPKFILNHHLNMQYRKFRLSISSSFHTPRDFFSYSKLISEYQGTSSNTVARNGTRDSDAIPIELENNPNFSATSIDFESFFKSKSEIHQAYIVRTSFLKIRSISLGYTTKEFKLFHSKITTDISIYVTNPFTYVSNKDFKSDPESSIYENGFSWYEYGSVPLKTGTGLRLQFQF